MRKPTKGSDLVGVLVFLIPCVQFIQVKAIGQLTGSDILLLAVFAYLALRGKIRIAARDGKWFLVLCSLWLASQCVTDIVRHSAFIDYVRGWSNIGLTLLIFMALFTLLYGRPHLIMLYGWGYVVGALLKYFVTPDDVSAIEPWKFGVGEAVTLAVFLLISRKESGGQWPLILSAAIGIINLMLGYRSMGGVCLSVALYLFVTSLLRKRNHSGVSLTRRSIVIICCSILLGMSGVYWAYQSAASYGLLGEVARAKYEQQSSGEYGMLLGGRVEMLGYIPAIIDSPILGHGSWAKDPKYVLAQHQAMALMGYSAAEDFSENDIEEGYIPTHSCLFGAWVDAGIVGALFWAWVFVLAIRALLRLHSTNVVILPLMSFVAFSLLWDVLFSPFGYLGRIIMPYRVVILMTCIGMVQPKMAMATAGLAKRKSGPACDRISG